MIVIFSIKYDYSTTLVMKWLDYFGEKVIRMNGDEEVWKFDSAGPNGIYFSNRFTGESINLLSAKACWWRRTGITNNNFTKEAEEIFQYDNINLTKFIKGRGSYIEEEGKALIEYICTSIYKSVETNLGRPLFSLNRLTVLDMVSQLGLKVPEYVVINKGDQLKPFIQEYGAAVTKAISNGIYGIVQNHRFYTYTELIEPEFADNIADIDVFPSLISGLIQKKFEIRTFYIEGHFYSMAIFSQSNTKTKIDFRKYANNRNIPYKLPPDIEHKIDNIFKELRLNCGSVDLIVNEDGEYIFLEINPVGQFGMTSDPCNYNLHNVVAKYLSYGRVY